MMLRHSFRVLLVMLTFVQSIPDRKGSNLISHSPSAQERTDPYLKVMCRKVTLTATGTSSAFSTGSFSQIPFFPCSQMQIISQK